MHRYLVEEELQLFIGSVDTKCLKRVVLVGPVVFEPKSIQNSNIISLSVYFDTAWCYVEFSQLHTFSLDWHIRMRLPVTDQFVYAAYNVVKHPTVQSSGKCVTLPVRFLLRIRFLDNFTFALHIVLA